MRRHPAAGTSFPAPLVREAAVERVEALPRARRRRGRDHLATEEPLEIRLGSRVLAVVMRTPGHDLELVSGLLFAEGIVRAPSDLLALAHCRDVAPDARENVVVVQLREGLERRVAKARRSLLTSSACGVRGRTSIEDLAQRAPLVADGPEVDASVLLSLPEKLRAAQRGFAWSGGLHAAGLFDARGRALVVREDVGRHNAVDKVIGAALRHDLVPLRSAILQVSGRASFEIVQKARVAGIPIVCAVSAPSTLAVDLAREGGQTLAAFVRGDRLNLYAGADRVRASARARPRAGAGAPRSRAPRPARDRRRRSGSGGTR